MQEDNVLKIERVFDAPVAKVWAAWTEADKIKQWWGPEGYSAPEVQIDFREGGKYLYCMRGPAGPGGPIVDAWSGGEFKEIVPQQKIVVLDYFADEHGNRKTPAEFGLPADFPAESLITITFEEEDGKTRLTLNYPIPAESVAREAMLRGSGMVEGWTSSLNKLAAIL